MLAEAPAGAVLAVIFLSCVVENFFPPSPSDIFVALAAFLSHQGKIHPLSVFATAWIGGTVGAVAVYLVARRHAPRFRASRIGQRTLPPSAIAFMEKEYHKYGALGIALVRVLPGFRAVVAPYAGLAGLSAPRALIPIIAACGLWYGGLTWLGVGVGSEWGAIQRRLDSLGSGLWVVTGALVVVIAVIWIRRRRRGKRGDQP
ncbi:MAG: DedA family protein [Gemmatimonadota bacterium]